MEAKRSGIGAVILAAGESTRMGQVKQLLRVQESTLLGRVLETVRSSRVEEIVLVLGHAAESIRQSVATEGVKVVINDAYRQGMGTSLGTGLSALSPGIKATFIVLADQPLIRSATLNYLIEEYKRCHAQIVIPTYKGFRGNPVLLHHSVFPEVMALSGDIGCRAIFGNHLAGIVKAPVDDIGILLDIDTQDDFSKLQGSTSHQKDEYTLMNAAQLKGRELPENNKISSTGKELIIVGREPAAVALAKLGKLLKFNVTVVDPLLKISDLPEADRVLNTLDFGQLPPVSSRYVVVASRGQFDEEAVEQALHAKCCYVALVANKRRAQEVRRGLEFKGESAEALATVRGPAGLDIGAETPEEIALSIMAEIVCESRKSREAKGRLRFPDRAG